MEEINWKPNRMVQVMDFIYDHTVGAVGRFIDTFCEWKYESSLRQYEYDERQRRRP